MMAAELLSEQSEKKLFEDIDSYPWDSDIDFQGGLYAILGPEFTSSSSQAQELTLRARLFYYAKKMNLPPINFDAYKAHLMSKTAPSAAEKPPYPVPFADIVALITSGQPVPGIQDIPSTVLSNQATQSVASKRRKPWETDSSLAMEQRTFGDRRDEVVLQSMPEDSISNNLEE